MKHPVIVVLPIVLMFTPLVGKEVNFGFQVGIAMPQGDVKSAVGDQKGYTVGINVPIDFNGGNTLRPHLNYLTNRGTQDNGYQSNDNILATISLGADWLYYVNKSTAGLYFIAGIGANYTKFDSTFNSPGYILSDGYSTTRYGTAVAFNAGFGWQFSSKFGTELQYNSASPNLSSWQTSIHNVSNLTLSLMLRF